jgi:protein-disulfide isomerase
MKNKWFVFGVVGFAIALFAVFWLQRAEQPAVSVGSTTQVETAAVESKADDLSSAFIRPHSPRFGNSMGRVTVVEWLDPECEACRAMHPIVKGIISDYGDRVLFVIRYMPYHQGSMFAASALEEAREFGKFEEALSILFDKQPEWGNHQRPRPDLIPAYLIKLGIPADRLDREKVIAKHSEKIRLDQEDGNRVGIQGTPSFFVNEKPLKGLGDDQLRAAIEQELALGKN